MLTICKEIYKNYEDNARRIYPEPPLEIYNRVNYGHLDCGILKDKISYMINLCPLRPEFAVIDIGSGTGDMVFALAEKGLSRVVGVDASQDAIEIAEEKIDKVAYPAQIEFKRMSATSLELEDNQFDLAYMADIVEHLDDGNLRQAISEAHRILKPGGRLVIHTAPTVNYKRFGQYFAKYYFDKRGIPWLTPTAKEESSLGHVNIQSKASLKNYLFEHFSVKQVQVFHGPVNRNGTLKKVVSMTGLWPLISPHLWAIANK
jgi:ubiquinone/menaquinone biosynthesis C-methylase UbiE